MSYRKYQNTRSASPRQKTWAKHCTNRLRRRHEQQLIQQEVTEYSGTRKQANPVADDHKMLQARACQRKQKLKQQTPLKRMRYSSTNYMSKTWVSELIEVTQKDRWPFYYGKDDYARQLLSYVVESGQSLHRLKQSPFGRLLSKPSLQSMLSTLGQGQLTHAHLKNLDAEFRPCYLLTLDQWGEPGTRYNGWQQTSRPGMNLVLQLNFSNQHNQPYQRLINPVRFSPFDCFGHPIASKPHCTLAWVRMDIAEDLSEALIEEIQTDWLRNARHHYTWRRYRDRHTRQLKKEYCNERGVSQLAWREYERVLQPHRKQWAEAALSAALMLLKEEMGIARIYYHSFASGNILKGLDEDWAPPRSLYTTLPKQFCFTPTQEPPKLLVPHIEALKQATQQRFNPLTFYVLDLRID